MGGWGSHYCRSVEFLLVVCEGYSVPHKIHGTNGIVIPIQPIHERLMFMVNVGKYTILGSYGLRGIFHELFTEMIPIIL